MRLTTYILAVLLAAASWSIGTGQPPPEPALQAEVARLIRQLDADRYEQREQASQALRQIGTPALAALRQARQHASMEVRWRARAIVDELTVGVRRRELVAFCSQSDERLDLEQGMWLIARIIDPEVQRSEITRQLDALAARVRERLGKGVDPAAADPQAAVAALRDVLFVQEGFTGNADDYSNPDNNAVHRVLTTHKGLPILLSHVTIAVARRLRIPIAGVPVSPYIVKYDGARAPAGYAKDDIYFHPYEQGRLLSREDRVKDFAGEDPDRMEPEGSRREILLRMLRNLISAYSNRGQGEKLEEAEELKSLLEAFAKPAEP
ncbi:MAG TPA: transglutaminase family protein [Pirellulaceae bacterium]|nr:transglutaminase family protein [Pirellulaceae bacterium]